MPERRLRRNWQAQRAMFRSQVTSFFKSGKIVTTAARAEEVSSIAEKLITTAKLDNLTNRRRVAAYLFDEDTVTKLFEGIAPKYRDRPGGYTRILKMGERRGDSAPMVILELV